MRFVYPATYTPSRGIRLRWSFGRLRGDAASAGWVNTTGKFCGAAGG